MTAMPSRESVLAALATMSEDEIAALTAEMEEDEHARAVRPLAFARLWDNPKPKTSQRRPLQEALGLDAIGIFGGNGSGKTEMGAMLASAVAHGRHHPDAVAWCEANGISPEMLPPYPGRVLASSLTSNDSRRVTRAKIRKYIPAGTTWRNENGDGEAEARLPGGGVIVFKSNDQKRRAYQADEFDVVWCDEEHDEDVISECFMRLDRRPWKGGYLIATMTPLQGLTHMHRDFVEKPLEGYGAWWVFGEDNPYADQAARARKLSRYGSHERAARDRGEFTALEGRVYVDWRRDLHVRAFELRPEWSRFVGIDWGTSVPTCILYAGYDAARDVIYIRKMVYRTEMTISERAAAIRSLEAGGPDVEVRWADPEDASTNRSLIRDFDIALAPAMKAVRWGINCVANRLRPDATGEVHLVVHPDCVELVREMDGYVWKGTGKDEPVKVNDHACDAERYLVAGISRAFGLAPPVLAEAAA